MDAGQPFWYESKYSSQSYTGKESDYMLANYI